MSLPRLGLRARLLLFVVALIFSVLMAITLYLTKLHLSDLHELSSNKTAVMRGNLRKRGLTLVRNLALSSQRAAVVRDYLFLLEVINSTVQHDETVVYGIIMDGKRRAIVHSDRSKMQSRLDDESARSAARRNKAGAQDVSIADVPHLEVFAPIQVEGQRWGTIRLGLSLAALNKNITASEQYIRDKIQRNLLIALSSIVAVLLVGSVLGTFVIGRMVLKPIGVLTDGVHRVRGGVLDQPIHMTAASEFVDLAQSFNSMSEAVEHRNQELRQLNEELEQRVEQRTADLVQANADLRDEIERRQKAEAELKHFAEQLQRSNRELEDFAYVASHDLQEPLRKVQAFGTRLQDKFGADLGTQGNDYLDRMLNASTRMRSLITELLNYSRVTTKAKPFELVNLNEVVSGVLSDLEVAIEQKGAKVSVAGLPTIDVDAFQMRQLFQNLIGNALKFQPEGLAPVVDVSVKQVGTPDFAQDQLLEGPFYRISVRDNGIGFEQKYAEKIFGLFQRLHGRSAYQGTGMGLAICRKIVERHGGRIVAESQAGEGASFIITIPGQHEGRQAPDGATASA